MKTKVYLLGIFLFLFSPTFAQQVSLETAQRVANIFLQNNVSSAMRSASATSTTTSNASVIKPIGKAAQSPVMYAVSQDSVWVLVSADERVAPILAYSDANAGTFPNEEDMPDGMVALLEWYEQQIEYLRDSTNITTIHEEWKKLDMISLTTVGEDVVSPLLDKRGQNRWKQSGNNGYSFPDIHHSYNKFCPIDENGLNTIVGCVGVAMGQLMWYWQWPHVAIVKDDDGHSLIREYNWNIMPGELTNNTSISSVDMVANLLHDAGVSVNMNYGINSSSASPNNIAEALINTFSYYSDELIHRKNYTSSDWITLLKHNLQQGYPILYGGRDIDNNGHRFIIDGYDSSNRFHINYGWGGTPTYFTLTTIVDTLYEFHLSQSAVLNIHPIYPDCMPLEISDNEPWSKYFILQNGGGINIGNKIIASDQVGIIYSGDYVKLTSGFRAKAGSKIHIAIRDQHCAEATSSAPQRIVPRSSSSSADNSDTSDEVATSNALENIESEMIQSTAIYTISGQLLQTIEGGQRDVAHLPSGMYILQYRMSDGSMRSEKIANNK